MKQQGDNLQQRVNLEGQPFHFIGVGGIGMSALAHILTQRNIPISGSDIRQNSITDQLESLGAKIFLSQEPENLRHFIAPDNPDQTNLPQVICSTAIKTSNLEYQAAVELNCPLFHRSDLLAALISESPQSIAIAGTHGKTTTSSLLGHLLVQANLDPTVVVGGVVKTWEGNARYGESPLLVAEADESDGSLVKFHAAKGVITNIELDHPDHYQSLDHVLDIFQTFVEHTDEMLVCLDCATIRDRLLPQNQDQALLTYSLDASTEANYKVSDIVYGASYTDAQVYENGQCLGSIRVPLLGSHNLSNTLAAIAIALRCGAKFEDLRQGLTNFEGAKRRFEIRGEVNGIRLIDDYAHHPSEIEVTLASARLQARAGLWKRVIAVFQPHRYSRAQTFLSEFSQAFEDADHVIVMDIYSAGEQNQSGINGNHVTEAIAQYHQSVTHQPTLSDVIQFLTHQTQPGDLVVFLGAGNLNAAIPDVLERLRSSAATL